MTDTDTEAPGWDAIDAALSPLYGTQQPRHWAAAPHWALGGSNPLDGASVYEALAPPHWHFVSYGMSDLYAKDSADPEVSGWGFEFTLRVARQPGAELPMWPISFLNNLGRYVFKTGNLFDVGHHMDLNGPIALGQETAIRALTFAEDPQLGTIHTPFGRVTFLQAVGLTTDELEAIESWDASAFLQLLSSRDPLLVTDLARTSWLDYPDFAAAAREGSLREGSSQYVSFVAKAEWEVGSTAQIILGANAVRSLSRVLPLRLPFGRSFALSSASHTIRFEDAPVAAWRAEADALVVCLPPELCGEFCQGLPARRGSYAWARLPGLEVTVVPSEIKDTDGNVVETVG